MDTTHKPVTISLTPQQAAALHKAIIGYLDGKTFATVDHDIWDRLDEILEQLAP